MRLQISELARLACCPRCRAGLLPGADAWRCSDPACAYAEGGFPLAGGQPVLIDFDDSIFDRAAYADARGSVLGRDDSGQGFRTRLRGAVLGGNPVAAQMAERVLDRLQRRGGSPLLLIVGGGALGHGTQPLYRAEDLTIVATDVYASAHTDALADGHLLPFASASFDAVWIQAVLEHVLDPARVVAEIFRVLKPGGIVYAETPFMQQVHEAAYDFTRFTCSGHRWLFRRFDEIESGPVGGAGTVLLWSIRYFVRSFGAGNKLALLATAPFFWLRYLDGASRRGLATDAASGTYFLGEKSNSVLPAKAMVGFYERQAGRAADHARVN